ncbi:MAG: aspartate kinase [Gammaproteobacteria bacterium]|jgi:aspartate kinase|nr:aspartate kinase [Gammaproteobacteria bacterium]MBT3859177.1 aspartate kinase [Gammaproteobacteria bacterium]MBT3987177.1 aspartate kinase [Gammaproteobacteria bacterium]MBT4257404.1 aspartate kinase [Gammaproteobacteria bacterium]MBT4583122.1 aspartate kinase [Gammaproteobacteria bacterium]
MALIVQKYGGTSVGTVEKIEAVADKIAKFRDKGDDIVVVVSAMSGETNRLTAMAQDIMDYPTPREMDVLLSTGEQVTIALLSMALEKRGFPAHSFTGGQVRILTCETHTKARIREIDGTRIHAQLEQGNVVVVAGFQGTDEHGNITTLGRGGSDTTAVALAAALDADECQIYTDVKGVYTTDPRVVEDARLLDTITFEEMLELASLGAKVLQIRAVEFAGKYKVPLRVLSSFEEGPGTLISLEEEKKMEDPAIAGIAFQRDEAKITVSGIPDLPGLAYNVIGPVSEAGIEVDVIVQNAAADNTNDITFTVKRSDSDRAKGILDNLQSSLQAREISLDKKIGKVSLVGVGMRSHAGIASKMFKTLATENINIQLITTSEIKISIVIEEKYLELAVRSLHGAFDLAEGEITEESN